MPKTKINLDTNSYAVTLTEGVWTRISHEEATDGKIGTIIIDDIFRAALSNPWFSYLHSEISFTVSSGVLSFSDENEIDLEDLPIYLVPNEGGNITVRKSKKPKGLRL